MGKILLIEPQSIVRQAISLFLFPEYEVEVKEAINAADVEALPECDLLIVDGAALRQSDQLSPEVVGAIEHCKIPILWLQEDESSQPPKGDRLATVKKPIERIAFQSALADLLSPGGPAREKVVSEGGESKDRKNERRAEPPSQDTLELIELVDVAEEEPLSEQEKKSL